MKKKLLSGVAALTGLGIASSAAVTVFIGDAASDQAAVTDLGSTDIANAGQITYAFFNDGYTNSSGMDESVIIENINFFSDIATGNLTAFVAVFSNASGSGLSGTDYSVISVSNAIGANAGVNNVSYVGSNSSLTLAAGETLVAGFYQDDQIVPFANNVGTENFLSTSGNAIPGTTPSALTSNNNFSGPRTYSFNVELDVNPVPEPSSALLLGFSGLALLRRRRS